MCLYQYAVPVCDPGLTPQQLESFLIENRLRQILCIVVVIIINCGFRNSWMGRGEGWLLLVWTVALVF
jgi:hypothetical protein